MCVCVWFNSYRRKKGPLWWCNGLKTWLANLHEWVRVSLGAPFIRPCATSVKVTYLGIRSAHERVWLVERKPIWLPRAYLTRGDLEPARGNLHVCKFLRELMNIQIRTVTAERGLCSECICSTNVLQLNEGRKDGKEKKRKERKEGRREPEGERERRKEGELGRKRERGNS